MGTRATECGQKSQRKWVHELQNMNTRTAECGHLIYGRLLYVLKASVKSHFVYNRYE
jgi:hypothetical protein